MKHLLRTILLLAIMTGGRALAADKAVTAKDVIQAYQDERNSFITASLTKATDPEFRNLLISERDLLRELNKPGFERPMKLLVLHEKLDSINATKKSIIDTRARKDELSDYFAARYQADIDRLRSEVAILETSLSAEP